MSGYLCIPQLLGQILGTAGWGFEGRLECLGILLLSEPTGLIALPSTLSNECCASESGVLCPRDKSFYSSAYLLRSPLLALSKEIS